MRTIWKYDLTSQMTTVEVPEGGVVIHVDVDNKTDRPCVWIYVETEHKTVSRRFAIFGTGHAMPDNLQHGYMGSVQQGPYVWHVWEVS